MSARQLPQHRSLQREEGDTVVIQALIGRLGDGDCDVREAAATAVGHAAEKGDSVVVQALMRWKCSR